MRSFDVEANCGSTVEQFRSAFGDEQYWLARLAAGDAGTATLDSLTVDADGTVNVATTFGLVRDRLPRLVAQLSRGDLTMVHNETWSQSAEGGFRGAISAAVPGVPLTANASALLAPVVTGSRLTLTGTVAMKMPVIGGAVEAFIGKVLTSGLKEMQTFTSEWIDEHGDVPG